ncbi:unnamed protein product [Hydatigera taeniaeformis]|uniref:Lipin_N domain-containing protein n=1 Tax=Hydatigena taeniaeformis TaxID=6205 RepID=A0A0R3XB38_HYDTA|nr:unnamed protein product [Hydatigera taeniaeformis]
MYSDINSATLSGAIDVIVVKYPNGELVSSPFYVQFGKTGVFRPCADEVEVVINGVPRTDLHMRVNRFGQAYFDDPDTQDDEVRPCSPNLDSGIHLDFHTGQSPPTSETCCSPIPSDKGSKVSQSNHLASYDKDDLLQSLPSLIQSADFRGTDRKRSTTSEAVLDLTSRSPLYKAHLCQPICTTEEFS